MRLVLGRDPPSYLPIHKYVSRLFNYLKTHQNAVYMKSGFGWLLITCVASKVQSALAHLMLGGSITVPPHYVNRMYSARHHGPKLQQPSN